MFDRSRVESSAGEMLPAFYARFARSVLVTVFVVVFSLGLGSLGYHFYGDLPWIDALLNASMILTGMGRSIPCLRRRRSSSLHFIRSTAASPS